LREEIVNLMIGGAFTGWLREQMIEQLNETMRLAITPQHLSAGKIAATVMDEILVKIENESKAYLAEHADKELSFEDQHDPL